MTGTVLLTGARGFLGRAVTLEFRRRNWDVIALQRAPWPDAPAGVAVVAADLQRPLPASLLPWTRVDVVVHLAAAGVKAADRDWFGGLAGNVLGTTHLLEAVATHIRSRRPVVLAHTFYEDALSDHVALRQNPYIATKWAAGAVAESISRLTSLPLRHARIFQVYGPGDNPGAVLNYVAGRLKAGLPAELGSGRSPRDWIHVSDAAACLVEISLAEGATGAFCDVGTGNLTTIREMAERLAAAGAAPPSLLSFDASRDRGDDQLACAAKHLPAKWRPQTSIADGLRSVWHAA
jgi:UDP-glucose 4-epimerase